MTERVVLIEPPDSVRGDACVPMGAVPAVLDHVVHEGVPRFSSREASHG